MCVVQPLTMEYKCETTEFSFSVYGIRLSQFSKDPVFQIKNPVFQSKYVVFRSKTLNFDLNTRYF